MIITNIFHLAADLDLGSKGRRVTVPFPMQLRVIAQAHKFQ